MNKNKLYKAVLLSVLGLAGVATVQAQTSPTAYNGDLLVGFTQTSGNDFIYDLGAASTLANGKTWNLAASLNNNNLPVDLANWGVIGSIKVGSTGYAWSTVSVGSPVPDTLNSLAAWANLNAPAKGIYENFTAAGAGQSLSISSANDNSWNVQTISPDYRTDYINAYGNPNVIGATSDNLYAAVSDGSTPTLIGSFSLSEGGVLTYNTVAAAAPQIVGITRTGTTSTIAFTTVNGLTYTLYYTNAAGLTAPVTTWPSVSTTVAGNGLTNSIPDTTTDATRFYRVGAY